MKSYLSEFGYDPQTLRTLHKSADGTVTTIGDGAIGDKTNRNQSRSRVEWTRELRSTEGSSV